MWTCLVCGNEIEDYESKCICGYEREDAPVPSVPRKTWTCLVCGNELEESEQECVCGYVRDSEQRQNRNARGEANDFSKINNTSQTRYSSSRPSVSMPASSTNETKLGFGWGYFLIVLAFFQGGLALFLGFVGGIATEAIPNRGVALLAGLFAIGLAIGLLKRKKFGLYLLYVTVALWILTGLFMVVQSTSVSIASGFFVIGLWLLWLRYFYRRRAMFH